MGNPTDRVIKPPANPRTARTMAEHIDLDVSGILRREMTLDEAGDRLIDIMIRTGNGRLTCAEALRHPQVGLPKLYPSAGRAETEAHHACPLPQVRGGLFCGVDCDTAA